jgi:DNA (cytosine-5)-methyltransferase 1
MKALDLFCGLGGFSDGLALEGFDVTGVEIEPRITALYKHRVIVADVCSLDPNDFKGFDLIVGSPPCRDFSEIGRLLGKTWKRPPDPDGEGMRLINTYLDFIKIAQPTYWLMENVPLAVPYVRKHRGIEARTVARIGVVMKRAFWGNFPAFLVPVDMKKGRFTERKYINGKRCPKDLNTGPLRAWERAKIPLPVARALGGAVKQALEAV